MSLKDSNLRSDRLLHPSCGMKPDVYRPTRTLLSWSKLHRLSDGVTKSPIINSLIGFGPQSSRSRSVSLDRDLHAWGGPFKLVLYPQATGRPSRIERLRETIRTIRRLPGA